MKNRLTDLIRLYRALTRYSKNRQPETILHRTWDGFDELKLFCDDLTAMLEEQPRKELQQKQAEYLALQNQINPHFLYNTLEAIRADALVAENYTIVDTTEALATFFRYTITDVQKPVLLADELDNVDNYFTIQRFRFGDKVNLVQNLNDEQLLHAHVPKLILQPLVENAVSHGLEMKMDVGTVTISVESSDKTLFISVYDDGVGIDEERVLELNECFERKADRLSGDERGGIALPNVNNRLKLLFGDSYGLHVFSAKNVGTEIRMTLPLVFRDET